MPRRILSNFAVEMFGPNRVTVTGVKLGSVLANLASIASIAAYIGDRTSSFPTKSGPEALNVVLHLAILTAIVYGVLWSVAERIFGWKYGAGANDTPPSGWSAVVLSLSMTLPLTFVPFLYQKATKITVVSPLHWRAMLFVVLLGAGSHLLMYGATSEIPNGLRQRIAPAGKHTPFASALLLEVVYSVSYFGFIVPPYRITVNPNGPVIELVIGRTLLPCLVFFFGMTVFIALKYPGSLRDPTWIQVRGSAFIAVSRLGGNVNPGRITGMMLRSVLMA